MLARLLQTHSCQGRDSFRWAFQRGVADVEEIAVDDFVEVRSGERVSAMAGVAGANTGNPAVAMISTPLVTSRLMLERGARRSPGGSG